MTHGPTSLTVREQRDATVFNLWLACETEEKIAEQTGISQPNVVRILSANSTYRFLIESGLFDKIDDEGERWRLIEAQPAHIRFMAGVPHTG